MKKITFGHRLQNVTNLWMFLSVVNCGHISNTIADERQSFCNHTRNNDVAIKVSDTRSAIVLMLRERYIAEVYRQLSAKDVYRQLILVVISDAHGQVNVVLSHRMKELRHYRRHGYTHRACGIQAVLLLSYIYIYMNKALNETANGNFKNTLIQLNIYNV